jgi:hypothetical protein
MSFSVNDLWKGTMAQVLARRRLLIVPVMAVACVWATGCTQTEETEVLSAVQGAVDSLSQNRALIEQFGRDIQSQVDKQDQQYPELMEQYEEARDAYNQYLDVTEQSAVGGAQKGDLDRSVRVVRNTSARFIESATRALAPNMNVRGIAVRNAIDLPPDVAEALKKIPMKQRKAIVHKYVENLQVRSWGNLTGGYSRELE